MRCGRCNHCRECLRDGISYESGNIDDREDLLARLVKVFPQASGQILNEVHAYEIAPGRKVYATTAYDYIYKKLAKSFAPDVSVAMPHGTSIHGPQRADRASSRSLPNEAAAASSSNIAKVTLGTLTVTVNGESARFTDRQLDGNVHAEDQLLQQFEDYRKLDPKVDWKTAKINVTITNFFCGPGTTKKAKKYLSCLERMVALKTSLKIPKFHVYFKRPYGKNMAAHIKLLQAAGIEVSSYVDSENEVAYAHEFLDSSSDTEETPDLTYDEWMKQIDELTRARLRQPLDDLVGVDFQQLFEFAVTPEEAYDEVVLASFGLQPPQ